MSERWSNEEALLSPLRSALNSVGRESHPKFGSGSARDQDCYGRDCRDL